MESQDPQYIRNIAVIAHVDHGKTTLVDAMLKQSNTFRNNQTEMSQSLILDSGDQEKERGITITSKVTAIQYEEYRINIIDTPGHADFSGEVERILNMADGCLLIVDAQEGPMPQTKFVLTKALANGIQPIVIINKIDKPAARILEVEDEVADLFLELAVDEHQLHYPVYFANGREGKVWASVPEDPEADADMSILFNGILEHIPAPSASLHEPFQMLVTALSYDSYKGKYALGKISRGIVKSSDSVIICKKDKQLLKAKIDSLYKSHGLSKYEVSEAIAGDIVYVTGMQDIQIGETIADINKPEALPTLEIEEPTLQIYLGPNTSPFKGLEGEFTTSRQIGERLEKELETNIGLRVEDEGIGFRVSGRGELHLSVLIETLRREGYEFEVGRPQVLYRQEDGKTLEPIEEVIIEVPTEFVGTIQQMLGMRRGVLKDQFTSPKGVAKLVYMMPTRTLLGLRDALLTSTKGTVIMNTIMAGYEPIGTPLPKLRDGALISFETGVTTPYSLENAEARGVLFVGPAEKVYMGQIIGLSNKQDDMELNVCKAKHLTNMRSSSSDGVVQLTNPVRYSLEQNLDFIEADELLEVTPKALRLRKRHLDPIARKRNKT